MGTFIARDVVEGIKRCQMAGLSIEKSWQQGKGKLRDALFRKLTYYLRLCLCYV
jgi:hypothetical protein